VTLPEPQRLLGKHTVYCSYCADQLLQFITHLKLLSVLWTLLLLLLLLVVVLLVLQQAYQQRSKCPHAQW
jgi:hypothetical protein